MSGSSSAAARAGDEPRTIVCSERNRAASGPACAGLVDVGLYEELDRAVFAVGFDFLSVAASPRVRAVQGASAQPAPRGAGEVRQVRLRPPRHARALSRMRHGTEVSDHKSEVSRSQRMKRRLFNLLAAVSLVICVFILAASIVLWLHSYQTAELLTLRRNTPVGQPFRSDEWAVLIVDGSVTWRRSHVVESVSADLENQQWLRKLYDTAVQRESCDADSVYIDANRGLIDQRVGSMPAETRVIDRLASFPMCLIAVLLLAAGIASAILLDRRWHFPHAQSGNSSDGALSPDGKRFAASAAESPRARQPGEISKHRSRITSRRISIPLATFAGPKWRGGTAQSRNRPI